MINDDEAEHDGRWPVDDLRDLDLHDFLLFRSLSLRPARL
jgi:hypothetical protein